MNVMAGMISPEMNCAPKLASYSSAFFCRNRSSTSRCRPNTFTSACPVYVSSICPFSSPVCFHCATNSFCERLAISAVVTSVSGMVTSAISASVGESRNIITSTPSHGQQRRHRLADGLLQALRDVVDVVGHPAEQLAALHRVEVAQRQPVDLRLDPLAQPEHRALHDAVEDVRLHPAERRGQHVQRQRPQQHGGQRGEVDPGARASASWR